MAKAKYLYTSTLFRSNLQYAASLQPDKIFVLSAKYGLVDLEQEIEPYDVTLNTMRAAEVKAWGDRVVQQLRVTTNLEQDDFVFLAGEKYRKHVLAHVKHYRIPLQGLSIGKQLAYLKRLNHE